MFGTSPSRRRAATIAVSASIALAGAAWSGCGDDSDEVQDAINDASDQAQEAIDDASQQAEDAADEAQQQADEAQQQAEDAIDNAGDDY